jgi:hypothetical protein
MNEKLKAKLKSTHRDFDDDLAKAILDYPEKSYADLAEELSVSRCVLYRVARERGIKRPHGAGAPAWGKNRKVQDGGR